VAIRTTSLRGCDGFKVETADGLIGWVEEPWLEPDGEPAGLALRLIDGRRGFVLAEDVRLVVPDTEEVLLATAAAIRELAPPRLARGGDGETAPSAAWTTTGELLEPPRRPDWFHETLLSHRPWRLAPVPAVDPEGVPWRTVVLVVAALALLVAVEIALAFSVAKAVTGHAY
jgi:hypothetical protein